jgi:serine/threonine protein phosphatase PrpC
MEEADREVRLKHIDLDDMSQHFRQGNIAPNKSNLNVFRSKAVFIGMYDGHGGNAASGALQQNLLKMAKKNGLLDVSADDEAFDWDGALKKLFVEVDEKLCDALVGLKKGAGSTCTIGIILTGSKTKLIVAHVGDSRAVASVSVPPGFLELTKDHCPSDEAEKAACEARGGKIARKVEEKKKTGVFF